MYIKNIPALILSIALVSCSNSPSNVVTDKRLRNYRSLENQSALLDKSQHEKAQAVIEEYDDRITNSRFVVGKSYKMMGGNYKPKVDINYKETGYALYYSSSFHGRQTASGPDYDEDIFTAAHRTLPLPSVVKVSNLENGREIVVIVSDRGPFACGDKSIIDLSRSAAEALGIIVKGKAKVRLEYLHEETVNLHKKLPLKERKKASFALNLNINKSKKSV